MYTTQKYQYEMGHLQKYIVYLYEDASIFLELPVVVADNPNKFADEKAIS